MVLYYLADRLCYPLVQTSKGFAVPTQSNLTASVVLPPAPHSPVSRPLAPTDGGATALPPITEIAAGPQPTRSAVDDYRAALAVSIREQGQAVRFVLQGMDGASDASLRQSDPALPPEVTPEDAALSALAPGLPPADPSATPAPREVIPRDPAPEPRITLTL